MIKTYKLYIILLLFCISTLSLAQDINFTGTWNGTWEYSDKSYKEFIILNLTQNDNIISGSGIDQLGVKATITGSASLNTTIFKVTPHNNSDEILFKGMLTNNTIKGTWHIDKLTGPWFAIKQTHNQ